MFNNIKINLFQTVNERIFQTVNDRKIGNESKTIAILTEIKEKYTLDAVSSIVNTFSSPYDGSSTTILHQAAKNNMLKAVKLLIELGANVNAIDYHKFTPLHKAVAQENEQIVKYLCSLTQINLNAQDYNGLTPLHFATRDSINLSSTKRIIEFLIQAGADIGLKNNEGFTPVESATQTKQDPNRQTEIVELLNNLKPMKGSFLQENNQPISSDDCSKTEELSSSDEGDEIMLAGHDM
ncbi:ankyrin repeat domain-containing protein [Rickettsia endosymbiont of Halotydeus destructor]|uniref:ankyrin repeat domain-containing protein n=1 Tax=Rickettsia endosymbiont of Halotydeus destructor TaxID=2996754 RepID=UPI003BAE7E1E